jgi:hypothetical protein
MEKDMDTKESGPVGQGIPAPGEKTDVIESMTQFCTRGIEHVAEIQKKGLDLAVQHNTELVNTWKKLTLAAPGLFVLDLATAAFERFADTQKGAIDLVVDQSHALAKLVRERKVKTIDTFEEGKAKAQEAIEHVVTAQKTALDYSSKQAKAAFQTAKQQLGYAGTPVATVADSMQRGMEVVVEAQKDLLDAMKEPIQILH